MSSSPERQNISPPLPSTFPDGTPFVIHKHASGFEDNEETCLIEEDEESVGPDFEKEKCVGPVSK